MRIGIDLTSLAFHLSGIERYAMSITQEWLTINKTDEFYLLFCNQVHPNFEKILAERKNVHAILIKSENNKVDKFLLFQHRILREIKRIQTDCMVFLAFEPPILYRDVNVIKTVHDVGFFDCPKMWPWYVTIYGKIKIRALLAHPGRIIAVSHTTKNRLVSRLRVDPERISVIYNAIDERFNSIPLSVEEKDRVRCKYKLPLEPYLLCLSTLEPRKNLALLIQVYDQMCRDGTMHEKLVLAGRKGWKIDNLLENVSKSTLDNIYFTGFIDDDDLPAVYKMARLFVFPSLYEGFGIPPLEAIACGTPALVSDLPVFQEIFQDAVIYFHNNDPKDLQRMLTQECSIRLKKLAQQASLYSWRMSAQMLDQLTRQVGQQKQE